MELRIVTLLRNLDENCSNNVARPVSSSGIHKVGRGKVHYHQQQQEGEAVPVDRRRLVWKTAGQCFLGRCHRCPSQPPLSTPSPATVVVPIASTSPCNAPALSSSAGPVVDSVLLDFYTHPLASAVRSLVRYGSASRAAYRDGLLAHRWGLGLSTSNSPRSVTLMPAGMRSCFPFRAPWKHCPSQRQSSNACSACRGHYLFKSD